MYVHMYFERELCETVIEPEHHTITSRKAHNYLCMYVRNENTYVIWSLKLVCAQH